MNFFSFFHGRNREEAQRLALAKKLHGQTLKYVIERRDNTDSVVGRESAIVVRGSELTVYAGADPLFRCPVEALQISELLSLEGAVLTGCDSAHGGEERTLIVYYTYYRKEAGPDHGAR